MSNRSSTSSSSENTIDFEELSQFRRELRKEKDLLKGSQSQSLELIRGFEMHVKSLSEARIEDKRRIKELERELQNCLQEIDYLQDQVNTRNTEVSNLQEQLKRTDFEKLLLFHELEKKDGELNSSLLCIEKLEESVSSIGLEYQCEIESLKLDLMTLEQDSSELKKSREENARMREMIKDLELQIHEMVGPGDSDAHSEDQLDRMSSQIHDYELLVSQLKEELKREKVKAKDNTDDLAQEMAELRYHMTELLEEERKRRACVEQVALQRISELEAQLGREEVPSQERKLIKHIEATHDES